MMGNPLFINLVIIYLLIWWFAEQHIFVLLFKLCTHTCITFIFGHFQPRTVFFLHGLFSGKPLSHTFSPLGSWFIYMSLRPYVDMMHQSLSLQCNKTVLLKQNLNGDLPSFFEASRTFQPFLFVHFGRVGAFKCVRTATPYIAPPIENLPSPRTYKLTEWTCLPPLPAIILNDANLELKTLVFPFNHIG